MNSMGISEEEELVEELKEYTSCDVSWFYHLFYRAMARIRMLTFEKVSDALLKLGYSHGGFLCDISTSPPLSLPPSPRR